MEDILDSLRRAMVSQGWVFGERMNRIGDPFKWVDGDQLSQFRRIEGSLAILQFLSMSGEIYETPKAIRTIDMDEMRKRIANRIEQVFAHFVPFRAAKQMEFGKYIESTASVKQQDYCAIKTFCPELGKGINHLDIGPGLGANAIYSRLGFDSTYYSVEAFPPSYNCQRSFFRFLSADKPEYLDLIDCENFGLSAAEMRAELNAQGKYRYKHVPSWHFEQVEAGSIDLVTATWVLNEVNPAGVCWLLYNINRSLKTGGYFYLRDSFKLKPLRHDLNYDKFLIEKLGFEQVGLLNIQNRVDMHGIPRAYRKTAKAETFDFDTLFETAFGRFSVTAHNGSYMQKGK